MCKRGNPIRSDIVAPNYNNMAAFKFNYMMKMLMYTSCKFNADEFLPFSYNYWLLLGKKKIAKYSVFLVQSIEISGAV